MAFAITLWDLGLWMAVSSFMVLVASEVIYPHTNSNFLIDQRKFRKIGIILGIIFLIIALAKIMGVVSTI